MGSLAAGLRLRRWPRQQYGRGGGPGQRAARRPPPARRPTPLSRKSV